MKNATLSASSYVVLGLLALAGPLTPYELKKAVDGSVGYFWSFPRAQLYVEPERLKELGYLSERREPEGRRRRTFAITDEGRAALMAWLEAETPNPVELRDTGILKLFFASELTPAQIVALAHQQEAAHQRRLVEFEATASDIHAQRDRFPRADFALATLRMGMLYERMSVEYWRDVAAAPPHMLERDS